MFNNLDSRHNERSTYLILGVQQLFNIMKSGIQVFMVLEHNALVDIDIFAFALSKKLLRLLTEEL